MNTASTQLRTVALSVVVIVLLLWAALAPQPSAARSTLPTAPRPTALTIAVPPFLVIGIGNALGQEVHFQRFVQLSDGGATLECDPPSGTYLARGGYNVRCAATLEEQRVEASFFLLVAYDTDTDVSVRVNRIAEDPTAAVKRASTVTYGIEVRNNGTFRAERVVVSGTIPETLDRISYDTGRCSLDATRKLTCEIFNLGAGKGDVLVFGGQLKSEVLGTFQTTMSVALGNGQRDLEPTLNSYTHVTNVIDPGFGPNPVFIPLIKQ